MRAVQFTRYADPDALEIAEVPEPLAEAGQIRVAVRASSVNPIDWKLRAGGDPDALPGRVGFDASGVVDQVGDGVDGVAVGDEVFGLGGGTAAELAVLGAWAVKPEQMPWDEAAAAGVAGETASRGLRLLGLSAGDTLLVDGAAGGVGSMAVQLAVAAGLRVIGTASERNHAYLRELGAEPIAYGAGLADRVHALAPGGVAGVFDVAGKTPAEQLVALAPLPTQVVSIANFAAGDSGIRVTSGGEPAQQSADLAQVARVYAEGRLRLDTEALDWTRAAEAHRRSEAGHVRGKLVLLVTR